jgi:acetyl esterase/lipase
MNDTEIGALRQKLASRARSDDYRQRRKDMDARALEYKIAPDVTVEPVTANGVRAEWTSTPNDARDAALIWLHGGGYVIGSLVSHRHLRFRRLAGLRGSGHWRSIIGWRRSTRSRLRSRTPCPATAISYPAAFGRNELRSPATVPAAASWLRQW